jgi:hypothetical protein
LRGGDDVGDGEGFAAAGDAEQGLMRQTAIEAIDQAADRLRLITGGLERVCMAVWPGDTFGGFGKMSTLN